MDTPDNLDDLKQVKLLSPAGELILNPETPGDQGFYLEEGTVNIYHGEYNAADFPQSIESAVPIATIKGPCIINCLSILSKNRIKKIAVSKTDCTVYIFPIKDIIGRIKSDNPFLNAILETNLERAFKHLNISKEK